jgi:methionine-rich copper-binding protein CopC
MKNAAIGLVGLFLLLGVSARALGHVFPDHAEPRVGSTVSKSPTEIKIWFTGDVEPAFSRIQVLDADGKQVDKKDSHQDAKDKTLLIVSVPELAAGTYKVIWEAVGTDTHKTTGDFKFVVQSQG